LSNWLVDADNPLLSQVALARVDDPSRPDRLAWNAFRTLALWETDVWVPRLLDVACGPGNPLAALEWSGASVVPWATGAAFDDAVDVLLDGPEALVVALATLGRELGGDQVRAGAREAVTGSSPGGKEAGLVAVLAPDTAGAGPSLEEAAEELADGAAGWLTWRDLGTLAVDLPEEADELRRGQVHRLVSDLQEQFPALDL
jgi:SAM-dependent methyltransferase